MIKTLAARPARRWGDVTRTLPLTLIVAALTVLLIMTVTLAVTIGPIPLPMMQVWNIAWVQLFGGTGDWTPAQASIVWLLRLPRVLVGAVVGAGLATVGVAMQALVRNPLADPYVLGVSSGASVGAVLALGMGWFAFAGAYAVSGAAFAGATGALALVFLVAHAGGALSPLRLVLAGLACSYTLSGLASIITLTSSNRELARLALEWLLGSVAGSQWSDLGLPVAGLLVGIVFLLLSARPLNALLLGDETAATLGIDVTKLRRSLFVVLSLVTGVMVAVSGAIGFLGLVVPHVSRMLVGTDHRRLLPVAALLGAIFLVWVDVVARMLFAPIELPVGVITAVLGGPFFIWMLVTQRWRTKESA